MTNIIVKKIPYHFTLTKVVKSLHKVIDGRFTILNMMQNPKKPFKACQIQLAENLDPKEVLLRINNMTEYFAHFNNNASVPFVTKAGKPMTSKKQLRKIATEQAVDTAFHELLVELQTKYTGLYNLSKKTQDKLLEAISKTIKDRLTQLMDIAVADIDNSFKLSRAYRKQYPHSGDFDMIVSTLHRLQDESGAPRTDVQEADLLKHSKQVHVLGDISYEKLKGVYIKYTDKISSKIQEHLATLDCGVKEKETEQDVAKRKVYEELKNLSPYMPHILKQVIMAHFTPQKSPFHRIRIYGEPFLPTTEKMRTFLKRYSAAKVMRSTLIYNMIKANVPIQQFAPLMEKDGTNIDGATLVVRASDIALYSTHEKKNEKETPKEDQTRTPIATN